MRVRHCFFLILAACNGGPPEPPPVDTRCQGNSVTAKLAALSVPLALNRLGAQVSGGQIFALQADLVSDVGGAVRLCFSRSACEQPVTCRACGACRLGFGRWRS